MKWIKVNEHQVFTYVQGNGEPVLFLHGLPDSHTVWQQSIDDIKSHYLCIAPDLPGFGQTQARWRTDYELESMANFVSTLLNDIGVHEPVHLVIHDIGGIFGLAFATTYPHRVKSLTIMATTFFTDFKWHRLATLWRKPVIGELMMLLMGQKRFSQAMGKSAPFLSQEHIAKSYKALTFKNRRLILKLYRTLDPEKFATWQDKLPGLVKQVPTQVIWGGKDPFLPVELATKFSTTDVHLFESGSHWPMLEFPQDVSRLLTRHFEKTSISVHENRKIVI